MQKLVKMIEKNTILGYTTKDENKTLYYFY